MPPSVILEVMRILHEEMRLREETRALEQRKPALDQDVSPIDDIRSTARYRGEVLARLLYWGLRDECPSFT